MRIEGMTTTPEASAKTLTQLVALEIRLEMVRQDQKQSDLARQIGKNEQWLSVRLRGKQPIDLNDLAIIARGLGVPVHQLLPEPGVVAAAAARPVITPKPQMPERASMRAPADNRPKTRQPDGGPPRARTNRVPRTSRP
jgi:transcriptional regulator with XRE-family HTH domain